MSSRSLACCSPVGLRPTLSTRVTSPSRRHSRSTPCPTIPVAPKIMIFIWRFREGIEETASAYREGFGFAAERTQKCPHLGRRSLRRLQRAQQARKHFGVRQQGTEETRAVAARDQHRRKGLDVEVVREI